MNLYIVKITTDPLTDNNDAFDRFIESDEFEDSTTYFRSDYTVFAFHFENDEGWDHGLLLECFISDAREAVKALGIPIREIEARGPLPASERSHVLMGYTDEILETHHGRG